MGDRVDRNGDTVDRVGNIVDHNKLSNSSCCRFVAKTGEKVDRISNIVNRIGDKVDHIGNKVGHIGDSLLCRWFRQQSTLSLVCTGL